MWHGGIKNRGRSVMRENSELRRAHCDVRELSKENIPHCWVVVLASRPKVHLINNSELITNPSHISINISRSIALDIIYEQVYVGRGWCIGRVDTFCPKGYGFDSRSSRHVGTLGKSFSHSCLWRFGVKFRHSFRAVSGAPS